MVELLLSPPPLTFRFVSLSLTLPHASLQAGPWASEHAAEQYVAFLHAPQLRWGSCQRNSDKRMTDWRREAPSK